MRFWLLLPLVLVLGCEVDTRTEEADSNAPDSSTPAAGDTSGTTTSVDASADQAEWDAIQWHTGSGPSAKGAVKVMNLSAKVSGDGSKVSFTWDRYPWSGMGVGHFFVWNGSGWSGGKFDWIRKGGQGTKLMDNVREGYNGLRIPPSGTRCAFAWTNSDGDERSNLAYTVWP